MQLCYIDESGNPGGSDTTHFVLAGLSVPDAFWKFHQKQIEIIKGKYDLQDVEIHIGWMTGRYHEQESIPGFNSMTFSDRRTIVSRLRKTKINKLKQNLDKKSKRALKNIRKTNDYIHLTLNERQQVVTEIANLISSWNDVRLFAECIDKNHFDAANSVRTINEQAFEQIVSRFEHYLRSIQFRTPHYGLIIHDNNQTVAKSHGELMKSFLSQGTLWTHVNYVIETPMFVDSRLTYMIQMADICAYALRRYVEHSEDDLFDLIFQRAHKRGGRVVGVRHFTQRPCRCKICRFR